MDSIKISRPYLEGLTTQELSELGRNFGVTLAPYLGRAQIIEELLEMIPCLALYQHNIIRENSPLRHSTSRKLKSEIEPVPLVTQYNMTYINALVRDPFWIFVFWEINSQDKKRYEKVSGFEGFVLRICINNPALPEDARILHVTQIQAHDTEYYLNFPHDLEGASPESCRPENNTFIVELCRINRGEAIVLASTIPFSMPKNINQLYPDTDEPLPPILLLSGLDRVNVVRGAL